MTIYDKKILKYMIKYYSLKAGMKENEIFDIPGPKGTFGQWFFSSENPNIANKKTSNKNKKKLAREIEIYQIVNKIIQQANLSVIKTLNLEKKNDRWWYTRLYPPIESNNLEMIDYSTNFIGDSADSWNILTPGQVIEKEMLDESIVKEVIPYELGKIWIIALLEYNLAIWEPEIAISRTIDNPNNQVFLIDFDKTCDVSSDYLETKDKNLKVPVYYVLTNIFPKPDSNEFQFFKKAIIEECISHDVESLGNYIIEGIEELFKTSS